MVQFPENDPYKNEHKVILFDFNKEFNTNNRE